MQSCGEHFYTDIEYFCRKVDSVTENKYEIESGHGKTEKRSSGC